MIWIHFTLIVLVTFILIAAVRIILRKAFQIEKTKKKPFSYDHINTLHKKMDWAIRLITATVLIGCLYLITFQNVSIHVFLAALIITSGTEYGVRAFFEWRYSENPKQSIVTVSEMAIVVVMLLAIIQFDLLVIS